MPTHAKRIRVKGGNDDTFGMTDAAAEVRLPRPQLRRAKAANYAFARRMEAMLSSATSYRGAHLRRGANQPTTPTSGITSGDDAWFLADADADTARVVQGGGLERDDDYDRGNRQAVGDGGSRVDDVGVAPAEVVAPPPPHHNQQRGEERQWRGQREQVSEPPTPQQRKETSRTPGAVGAPQQGGLPSSAGDRSPNLECQDDAGGSNGGGEGDGKGKCQGEGADEGEVERSAEDARQRNEHDRQLARDREHERNQMFLEEHRVGATTGGGRAKDNWRRLRAMEHDRQQVEDHRRNEQQPRQERRRPQHQHQHQREQRERDGGGGDGGGGGGGDQYDRDRPHYYRGQQAYTYDGHAGYVEQQHHSHRGYANPDDPASMAMLAGELERQGGRYPYEDEVGCTGLGSVVWG